MTGAPVVLYPSWAGFVDALKILSPRAVHVSSMYGKHRESPDVTVAVFAAFRFMDEIHAVKFMIRVLMYPGSLEENERRIIREIMGTAEGIVRTALQERGYRVLSGFYVGLEEIRETMQTSPEGLWRIEYERKNGMEIPRIIRDDGI